jgi:hypothetical protein
MSGSRQTRNGLQHKWGFEAPLATSTKSPSLTQRTPLRRIHLRHWADGSHRARPHRRRRPSCDPGAQPRRIAPNTSSSRRTELVCRRQHYSDRSCFQAASPLLSLLRRHPGYRAQAPYGVGDLGRRKRYSDLVTREPLTVFVSLRDCGGSARGDSVGCVRGRENKISALSRGSRATRRTGVVGMFSQALAGRAG